ncbi:hypothetical protein M427DRAFT_44583 [Gonapodya prolifera JEL478]|uniref:F-box domain-containing protein n=1 Tax=Gonapodya prolifera (strain JEL478) TaxID=1344416 RepID=A0A139AEP2_GONPJ|nr:hypothetical protein M427DRAFT_44583 [Gonapodya prolifera JEL478]|eukprot:KXS15292.1 hypothetical protein M427DRAFT_44583 [Gonapodya prolifera JEL478]
MITPLTTQPLQSRSKPRHLSLDVLPAELIPSILTHLPPRDILLSFTVLSRRYKQLVADFFRPDGRPGILVDVRNQLTPLPPVSPYARIKRPIRLRFTSTVTIARGRRIVGTLDIFVRTASMAWGLDMASLAAQIESTSPLAFAGLGAMPLLRSAPPHVLVSWLSDPISRPVELKVTADMTSVLCSIPNQPSLSFPTIESVTYDGAIKGVPQHLRDRTTGLFPSCKHITLGRVSCSEDIPNMVHSLVGKNTSSLTDLTVSGTGTSTEEDGLDPLFYELPHIVSGLPSLRSLTLFAPMDWIRVANIEESKIRAPDDGSVQPLRDLHLRTSGLAKNPSASLGVLARSLSVMFPRLKILTMTLDDVFTDRWPPYFNIGIHTMPKLRTRDQLSHKRLDHSTDTHIPSLLNEHILLSFADFVSTQPAHKVRLTISTLAESESPNHVKVSERASIVKKFGRMLCRMIAGRGRGRGRGKRVVVAVDR